MPALADVRAAPPTIEGYIDNGDCCGICRSWKPYGSRPGKEGWGQCRRRAPTRKAGGPRYRWPETRERMWCGEFDPAIDENSRKRAMARPQ